MKIRKYIQISLPALFCLGLHLFVQAQPQVTVGISMDNQTYHVSKVEPFREDMMNREEILFFNRHFSTTSYAEYRSFYINNSCLASEEDFKQWRTNLNGKQVRPEAVYVIYSGKDSLCIISYSITSGEVKSYFPLALLRSARQWYLLDLKRSQDMMGIKMFMTYVQPEFLRPFLTNATEMKNRYLASIYTAQGNLNGDLLMNYFDDRYDAGAQHAALSNTVFHDVAELSPNALSRILIQTDQLATEYNLSASRKEIIERMVQGGNYSGALAKIAAWSDTFDVIEITNKFYSRLQENANSH